MMWLETLVNSFVCLVLGHRWAKTWRLHDPETGTTTQTYCCMRWPCAARKQEIVR